LALFGVIIAAVLIGQGGGDDGAETEDGGKPTVEVPDGPPPEELEIEDLEEGEGAEAQEGDALQVDYVGVLYDTGEEFDNSYDPGKTPLPVTLGEGGVVPGFEQGLEGMKEGGQRQIIIPPDLGYGPQGNPPAIPPDSTLIFVVELVSVN
jgi:peptidylprolyl isomerase